VVDRVEQMVRLEAASEGIAVRAFRGNSLELLAKSVIPEANGKITYLPSGASNGLDRKIMDLREKNRDVFRRVANGEMGLSDAGKGIKDFASYALDATSNGLGVNTNQRLWILRCGMDVHDRHMREWTDVLAKVDEMVRVQAVADGVPIRELSKIGLEALAKDVSDPGHGKITYLPSRQSEFDGQITRLRRNKPELYKRVVGGELSLVDARRSAGMKVQTDMTRAKSLIRNMTAKERRGFIAWMREEGFLD
jgi:hypothetical protein